MLTQGTGLNYLLPQWSLPMNGGNILAMTSSPRLRAAMVPAVHYIDWNNTLCW